MIHISDTKILITTNYKTEVCEHNKGNRYKKI